MTRLTVIGKLFAVFVGMAVSTGRIQTEKGTFRIHIRVGMRFTSNPGGAMT